MIRHPNGVISSAADTTFPSSPKSSLFFPCFEVKSLRVSHFTSLPKLHPSPGPPIKIDEKQDGTTPLAAMTTFCSISFHSYSATKNLCHACMTSDESANKARLGHFLPLSFSASFLISSSFFLFGSEIGKIESFETSRQYLVNTNINLSGAYYRHYVPKCAIGDGERETASTEIQISPRS